MGALAPQQRRASRQEVAKLSGNEPSCKNERGSPGIADWWEKVHCGHDTRHGQPEPTGLAPRALLYRELTCGLAPTVACATSAEKSSAYGCGSSRGSRTHPSATRCATEVRRGVAMTRAEAQSRRYRQ